MINPAQITSSDLNKALHDLEDHYIDEIEDILISTLMEKKSVQLHGDIDEVLEFAGRTNYKLLLRRPHKNVWSVSFKDFRESVRKVLRRGPEKVLDRENNSGSKKENLDLPTHLLLHVIPENEYQSRSFVGNKVVHSKWGIGEILSISESGNVKVEFNGRHVVLKPNFIELQTD
ncbi:MAG: hypothetical protein JXL67_10390 [Calditrichaeota bacterium]|nr:hypothetical protein [Calditrichota bacterium]RQV92528.1 MAG: hypothetical protein EH221_11320 [bacterium]